MLMRTLAISLLQVAQLLFQLLQKLYICSSSSVL